MTPTTQHTPAHGRCSASEVYSSLIGLAGALMEMAMPSADDRLIAAQKQEETRQDLLRGEATPKTLAYARYLSACSNDATFAHGKRKRFEPDKDQDIAREWPFLAPLLELGSDQ